jgi:integrase/recombinase XerC
MAAAATCCTSDSGALLADSTGVDEALRGAGVAWLDHLIHERGLAVLTREAYARDLRTFFGWLANECAMPPGLGDLARLNAKSLRRFLAHRRRQGIDSRTLARNLSALRMFFRWLEATSAVHYRAAHLVALPKISHSIPKPLTVDRAAAVVDGGMGADLDWVAARDTAVLLLLYGAGLRRDAADGRQREQGTRGAGAAGHAGSDRTIHRAVPLSA